RRGWRLRSTPALPLLVWPTRPRPTALIEPWLSNSSTFLLSFLPFFSRCLVNGLGRRERRSFVVCVRTSTSEYYNSLALKFVFQGYECDIDVVGSYGGVAEKRRVCACTGLVVLHVVHHEIVFVGVGEVVTDVDRQVVKHIVLVLNHQLLELAADIGIVDRLPRRSGCGSPRLVGGVVANRVGVLEFQVRWPHQDVILRYRDVHAEIDIVALVAAPGIPSPRCSRRRLRRRDRTLVL